ncbi:MAG TPA: ATP-binding protein [Acidobacteriota bacterium]|nr:ATP-binding protein [Acidobacteriota bacterium]
MPKVQHLAERQALALDALSKLARQFAGNPNFDQLVHALVLTITGQFASSGAFVVVRNRSEEMGQPLLYATGRFVNKTPLIALGQCHKLTTFFRQNIAPFRATDLVAVYPDNDVVQELLSCGVQVIAPLVLGEKLVGLMGIGARVNGAEYDGAEIEFLGTLANSVTPFLASSILFRDIAGLNAWHLEILNSVKQGVFVFDGERRLSKMNDAACAILESLGPDQRRCTTQLGEMIERVFPETVFPGWTQQIEAHSTGRRGRVIESLVARGSDSERIFNVRVGEIGHSEAAKPDLVVTVDDISKQKDTEHHLFELEKFAEKGMLASSIGHELNNYLGLILGNTEVGQHALENANLDKVASCLAKLKDSVGKMARFTAGLMDYSRMETRQTTADLNAIIGDVLSFVTVHKKFKRITVDIDLDPTLRPFLMDPDQIAQLLLNFLNNAGDAITEARRSEGRITVGTRQDGRKVTLAVSDNGAGIPPEVRDVLFQSRKTTKEKGHGFGLVTCGKIVENHHGRVTIDTEVGRGTTFTVHLPLGPPA